MTRVQFSDDGLQVISGSRDGTVLVSPIMRARSHDELRGHCWCAHAARSSQQVRFWDVASGQQVRQVLGVGFRLGVSWYLVTSRSLSIRQRHAVWSKRGFGAGP